MMLSIPVMPIVWSLVTPAFLFIAALRVTRKRTEGESLLWHGVMELLDECLLVVSFLAMFLSSFLLYDAVVSTSPVMPSPLLAGALSLVAYGAGYMLTKRYRQNLPEIPAPEGEV